ncbi:hypothetical protein BGZ68_001637 [Mortierella alpina]|nr:hypothetical protein BGZ68_001637 [Mortierella alpina]
MTMVTASPSSQAAEALLSRARLLSSNAYERTRSATPTAFAEGEDLIGSSSSLHARTSSSPSLSPISTLSTASLHQRHRSSFNDYIRDHNKRRSSVQRLSSGSASSTKAASLGMNTPRDEKSSDARDLQSAEGPATPPAATAAVAVKPSTNKLLSTPSSSSTSSTTTPLTPSTSSQSFVDSHNTGAQTLALSACPTPESASDPSHTLTISTRPRASTLESTTDNRENSPLTPLMEGVQPGSATSTLSPVDLHRKHRSENGGSGSGLVLGILEVLRDGEKVSVPLHRTPSTPKLTFSGPSEPQSEPSKLDHASQSEQSSSTPTPTASATLAAAVVSTTPAPKEQQAQQTQETQPATPPPAPTSTAPSLPTHNTPAPPTPSKPVAPEKGSLKVDTAFLSRKTRSESVSTQGSVESCPSPQAPSPSVKQARRSSKLFGKLVPKFLQTSFSPSNATGSPRSALPASSSPLTTRPGRSASFAGGSSSSMVAGKGLSSGIGSIAEETTDKASALPPLPITLPSLPASVLESGEDWLSTSSKMQDSGPLSASPEPSASNSASNKAVEKTTVALAQEQEQRQDPVFDYKVEVEYDTELETKKQEQTHEQVNADAFSNDMSTTHESEEPASSPYTIDENCDDDFFLNSVLRKKSRPQSPPALSTGSEAWSAGRTPSLSNSSSSSGSPSPTSPMAPTFAYTSTPLSASPMHSTQYHHYQQQLQQQQPSRSNTYPSSQVHSGMDEKRSRLRDAVGEWRRSANASSGSMHSPSLSYSSPAVPALSY